MCQHNNIVCVCVCINIALTKLRPEIIVGRENSQYLMINYAYQPKSR